MPVELKTKPLLETVTEAFDGLPRCDVSIADLENPATSSEYYPLEIHPSDGFDQKAAQAWFETASESLRSSFGEVFGTIGLLTFGPNEDDVFMVRPNGSIWVRASASGIPKEPVSA